MMDSQPRINVRVHNYAQVSSQTLAQAEGGGGRNPRQSGH